jgi:hypothetical protein
MNEAWTDVAKSIRRTVQSVIERFQQQVNHAISITLMDPEMAAHLKRQLEGWQKLYGQSLGKIEFIQRDMASADERTRELSAKWDEYGKQP